MNEHEGNVWTGIISITREDAERLGYNSVDASNTVLICDKYVTKLLTDCRNSDYAITKFGTSIYVRDKDFDEESSYSKQMKIVVYNIDEGTEPLSEADKDFFESIEGLDTDHTITVTDQNGEDVSYLLKYIVNLKEVN